MQTATYTPSIDTYINGVLVNPQLQSNYTGDEALAELHALHLATAPTADNLHGANTVIIDDDPAPGAGTYERWAELMRLYANRHHARILGRSIRLRRQPPADRALVFVDTPYFVHVYRRRHNDSFEVCIADAPQPFPRLLPHQWAEVERVAALCYPGAQLGIAEEART